ncbi:pre-mRNA-processing factor 39-like isoform X1 [Mauremys reevesii]|uniref:pre-mRNA-processing factor 39-like isoform X1 n=1 Tax=Mauremys reevesii TaxID=260615 RepID=UPI00193F1A77|nr:pre-mRNA-processing factor 39-like isoform X1 [Mauremys reevesii]
MAAEGLEAAGSTSCGGAGTERALGGGSEGGESGLDIGGPNQDSLPDPPSDSISKQEDTKAVQGCNGVNAEASVSRLKDPYASEENCQYPAPEEEHAAVATPVATEEASLSYPLEFEKYWKAAHENPHDFTAWTELLQYVEQENHIFAARKAFDAFFARYPYCYGYWKKYADMERRFDFSKETEEVFERGLQSIPLSMDLWIHYISYLQATLDMNLPESIQKIHSVFESAVAAAGMDFRSDKLWELYVEWEKEQGDLKAITAIYDRVLATPTQLYSHHWEKFKEHVMSNSPKDILSAEELLWLQSKITTDTVQKSVETEVEEVPPGEDLPPGVEVKPETGADAQVPRFSASYPNDADFDSYSELTSAVRGDLDQDKIRELVISIRQQVYTQNEAEVSKRWNFEEGIKRPYFHVKPLERAQLKNWRDYLDYEITSGSHERTIVLFERCVIACALYEEFWIKYTKYLENHTVAGARSVFQRACGYHLPRKPNIHLLWAAFEEKQGDLEEARRILKSYEESIPGLAMVRLRRVSLERRHGNLEAAEALLQEAIRDNEGMPLASFYAIKLARQVLKVQKNLIKARKVLMEALEKDPENAKLHTNLLEIEFSADVRQNEGNTMNCFERALSSGLPEETKIVFSQRRVEFLEDFGSSIHSLLTAYDEHQKFLKHQMTRKRAPENGCTDEPEDKKLRAEDSPGMVNPTAGIPPLMGTDLSASPAAAYNYNTWYQNYGVYGYQNPWNYNQYYSQS